MKNYIFYQLKQATAEAMNLVLYNDCMDVYNDLMQEPLLEEEKIYSDKELKEIHLYAKGQAMQKVYI